MTENEMELKLFSPLTADLMEDEDSFDEDGFGSFGEPYDYYEGTPMNGDELVQFKDVILDAIKKEELPGEAERGLMTYFYGEPASVNDKVMSAFPTVEEYDGKLWGVMVCKVKEPLTPAELEGLKSYCSGQYSDGWGEGFEQRERKTEYGDLLVHFWQSGGEYSIRTEHELVCEAAKAHQSPDKSKVKHDRNAR